MKNNKTNKIVKIGIFAAVSAVLMVLEFPFPFFPGFLKFEISDVPALIGSFSMGPLVGVIIELIKNLIKILIKGTSTAGIGELANFSIAAVWVFVAGVIYKKKKSKKSAIIALAVSVISMSLFGAFLNYTVLLPLYGKAFGMEFGNLAIYAVSIILPFNLLKGSIVSVLTFLLYKNVSKALKLEEYDSPKAA